MKYIHEKLTILVVLIVAGSASARLVGHWALDEGSGTTTHDLSGNGNDGVFKGDPEWIVGIMGNGLKFDGDDYVDCGNGTSLDLTGPITISVWIKPEADETQKVAALCKAIEGAAGWSWQLRYGWNSPKPFMGFVFNATGGMVWVYVNQNLTLSEWCHVAASYDGSTVKCYLNGKETDSAVMPGFVGGRSPLLIGQAGWRDCWIGAIDDVRIYDHGLYEEEVTQLCAEGSDSFVPPPPALQKLIDELHKARSITEKQGPKKAIVFLEKKIAEYELWKEKNTNQVEQHHEFLPSELHFLLAEAKEAANAPTNDIATAYKQSISQKFLRRNYVPALLWLFENISAGGYADVVKKSVRNSIDVPDNLNDIAKDFESSKNWAAFKLFFETIFSEVNDSTCFAEAIASGLREGCLWADNFTEYVQSKPKLLPYIVKVREKCAQENIEQNKFLKAAEIYHSIANQCSSEQNRITYELKMCECIFESGEYDRVLSELNDLINNKSVNEDLVTKAMLLKGQVYLQLSEIDRAYDIFSKLMSEYPKTERALEASFFIGYCNMLRSKYKEAIEALNRIVGDCPQSSYANKARLCLTRIKRVTE
jgi:tetratricopeptide (TPR) repeat protein